jgi:hypothetical protein
MAVPLATSQGHVKNLAHVRNNTHRAGGWVRTLPVETALTAAGRNPVGCKCATGVLTATHSVDRTAVTFVVRRLRFDRPARVAARFLERLDAAEPPQRLEARLFSAQAARLQTARPASECSSPPSGWRRCLTSLEPSAISNRHMGVAWPPVASDRGLDGFRLGRSNARQD